jgi:iron complex transport system substrate-binding protein
MRIISLVPNGTEILFALGAGPWVVGVSHECDFPPEARALPQLTGSALAANLSASEIDAAVSAQLAEGRSLYTLDEPRIVELAADLIVTQELCPVCAVSTAQVDQALTKLRDCPQVLSLDPKVLADVFQDITRVGSAVGLEAEPLLDLLQDRLLIVSSRLRPAMARPRVVALEWLDPPFVAGHWVPEMIALAGGEDALAHPGDPSRRIDWHQVAEVDPDFLVVMPCGFDGPGATREMARLHSLAAWQELRAVRQGRAVAVDANGLFSRPGPRLVDGIEHLASLWS